MDYILLFAAIFNFCGGVNLLASFIALPASEKSNPPDYAQSRLFVAGTAFTFAALYLYLFLKPEYAMPFLLFGMGLKFWAFVVSVISYARYGFPKKGLVLFGVANLVFGLLFAAYLLG